ncbi:MAG TPA: hypothetical protein VN253_20855 [Kofleriaceae bacterium]|nr:hypothetical protein [Kofleriaceae bacterium]
MNRLLLTIAGLGLVAALHAPARAQVAASFNAGDAVDPISVVEGPGVKVGEGTVLHPVFGVETGVISNVFYEDTGANPAGLLRLLAQVGTGSLGKQRLATPGPVDENPLTAGENDGRTANIENGGAFQYRADLRLSYDFMLSGNDRVAAQGGLGVGANLRGIVNPQATFSLAFLEDFERIIRATNFESRSDTNRIRNHLNLRLNFAPKGRTLSGLLRYDNNLDYFENASQQFANRLQHSFGLRGMWQWLPVTRIYADASIGVFGGLGASSTKVDSYPLNVEAGIQTLLTLSTTLIVHAGYTNGFYASGPSFSSPAVGAQIGYRYSPLGRVTLMYDYSHTDSINANFYRDHTLRATLEQGFVPFILTVRPEFHLRQYNGITVPGASSPVRDDVILALTVGAHYNFRNWIAATLDYSFTTVQTNFTYMPEPGVTDDPSFVRHELLVGMRAAL